jgi:hypothetical protein
VFGICLWTGVVTVVELALLSVVLLPPYLLLVACGLGVWLGFSSEARASGRAN